MSESFEFSEIEGDINLSGPLIYLWEVFDLDGNIWFWYVGRAMRGADRPRTQYRRNVNNLLAGKPYGKSKPDEFRVSHRKLAEGMRLRFSIRLSFVCNVASDEDINAIERRWQRHYDSLHSKTQQVVTADRPKSRSR